MRRTSLGLAMTLLLGLASSVVVLGAVPQLAEAQAPEGEAQAPAEPAAVAPAAPVLTDPVSGERYVEVRPTDVIERGRWAVPPWLVWCLGALATVTGAAVLARRMTRARRGR